MFPFSVHLCVYLKVVHQCIISLRLSPDQLCDTEELAGIFHHVVAMEERLERLRQMEKQRMSPEISAILMHEYSRPPVHSIVTEKL